MTATQFSEKQEEIIKILPKEFHEFVTAKAWDDGHAHGYEEVLTHLQDLVYGLSPAVAKFYENVTEAHGISR